MTDPVATEARLLDGRYRLLDHLGSGGMGAVYRAHDLRLEREVAVKVLRDGSTGDVHRARLQAEARLAGGLQHPGIVRVLDYGEDRQSPERSPYVVMQHVPGRPLSAQLREDGVLAADTVAALLRDVADALAEAHAATVVHRDLKPSNIIVRPDGRPVLVDFGIARSEGDEPLTQTGEIVGTADYLSPEQVSGQRAVPASDVYALGVVAYQCLTGVSPFHRESHVATALAHLHDTAPALPATVPPGLRQLVEQMLEADPVRRPEAAEVSRRAARLADDPTTDELSVGAVAAGAVDALWPFRPPRRRSLALAGAAVVALVGGLLAWGATGGDPVTPPAEAGVTVPDVLRDPLAEARRELHEAGFEVDVVRVDVPRPPGVVLKQSPGPRGPRSLAPDGSTVTLRVSSGWVGLDVDTLIGDPYAEVAARLTRLGLVPVRAGTLTSTQPAGTVVETGMSPGPVRLRAGSTVPLVLAVAPAPETTRAPAAHGARSPGPARGHAPAPPGKAKGHHKPPHPPKGKKPHP